MLNEQNFELKGLGPLAVHVLITDCFHDKTIISKENHRVDYLLLKYCSRQCTMLSPSWAKSLAKFNIKMQDLNVF